jgi:hypothetical protein
MSARRLAPLLTAPLAIVFLATCGSDDKGAATTSSTPSSAPQSTTAGVCARPIPPLTSGPVTKQRLEAAVQKLNEVQQAADSGDASTASAAFAGDAHDVTHDIDQPLRAADPVLARDLCESILILEQQFSGEQDRQTIAAAAGVSSVLLQDSGRALRLAE